MFDEEKIRDTAEAVEGLVKAVPIYQDALQPAAKQIGAALETVAKAIHAALLPLRMFIWGIEQIERWLIPTLAEKLKDVPEDRIITPSPTVAGPALEALRFAGHDPSLRELFANLLATAMDAKTAKDAHPAFVEILRQLTPDEARIVQLLPLKRSFPLINVNAQRKDGMGTLEILRHFSLLGYEAGCSHPESTPTYLDNLFRLGLVEIPEDRYYVAPGIYEPLEKHPQILELISSIERKGDRTPEIAKKGLWITTLGRQFCDACVVERDRS